MKIRLLLSALGITALAVVLLSGTKGDTLLLPVPNNSQSTFEQNPPYAIHFWVQKLQRPTKNKENIIFRVEYQYDGNLPDMIRIFRGSNIELTFRDNGVFPDLVAGDHIFSAYKAEDITNMITTIQSLETTLNDNGYLLDFNGHDGRIVSSSELPHFSTGHFQQLLEVEISPLLLDVIDCNDGSIQKEKSLFITDIAVVEDQQRTFNVFNGTGNPSGAWNFGTLMDNIENNQHTDGLRGFLKEWVASWVTTQTVNQTIPSRDYAVDLLIEPWLQKALSDPTLDVDDSDWESYWDGAAESNLKTYAPFKLTAIVNRIDLRGNSAYNVMTTNSGETRFIYSLIDPYTGKAVIAPTQTAEFQLNTDPNGFVDWRGMNVIFEYGNTQTTLCEIQAFAQQWADLSDPGYSFGTASANNAYKDALQAITDQVTTANLVSTKVNGSAIDRIRTNEKAFATFNVSLTGEEAWAAQDWEFRQFELSATTHGLKMVPLTNNPYYTDNYAPNIDEAYPTGSSQNHDIMDWVFTGHTFQVTHGNFNLPSWLLGGDALVRREESQYLDLDPEYFQTKYPTYVAGTGQQQAKTIRQQLSVNTCAGCHGGETKTVFTHVNTLGYGQTANYWSASPDGQTGTQDNHFYPYPSLSSGPLLPHGKNMGETFDVLLSSGIVNFDSDEEIVSHTFFQSLSPFLTGRRHSIIDDGSNPVIDTWEDDFPDTEAGTLADDQPYGLFYVNDPSNDYANYPFPEIHDTKWGFNDLQRRLNDLCLLINSNCTITGPPRSVMQLMALMDFVPFPTGSH